MSHRSPWALAALTSLLLAFAACGGSSGHGGPGQTDTVDSEIIASVNCGDGVCAQNPQPSRCDNGREVPCQPGLPIGGDLDCNGVDDDCDGRTDEGYVVDRSCGRGVCAANALPSEAEATASVTCPAR